MPLLTLALLVVAVPVPKDRPAAPPKGPPPGFYVVSKVDAGRLEFEATRPVMVQEVVAFPRPALGKDGPAMDVVYITHTSAQVRRSRVVLQGVKASTVAGEELSAAQALKRLAPGAVVLCSADGRPVDPAYLGAARPETVIVILPRPPAGLRVPELDTPQP